jgi:hypothetical protein
MRRVRGWLLERARWASFGWAAIVAPLAACSDDAAEAGSEGAGGAIAPTGGEEGVAQLRLLTRREYDATVRDLFFAESAGSAPRTCDAASDCDVLSETCTGGVCVTDPCNLVTFALAAPLGAYGSVVVAGEFNGWDPNSEPDAMTYEPSVGSWIGKRTLADGAYAYKFVIDGGNWLADPSNPITEPDGFGGVNSVATIDCADEGVDGMTAPSTSFTQSFPVESRPERFPFDNAAESGLVTAVHAEQYFRAAELIAELAASDLEALLGCAPTSSADPCVTDFVERVGRRAYRRPLTPEESDRFGALIAAQPDAQAAVEVALRVVLGSPSFLYRSEVGEPAASGLRMLTPWETATALAYMFWGTAPDDLLLDAAASGGLDDDAAIADQARRLLDDPRARLQLATFAEQWLGIERVAGIDKGARDDGFDADLSRAMADETRAFVVETLLDRGEFGSLFTADRTQASPRLAAWYGADADGLLPEPRRAGLLAQGSVLASHAHSNQTSPVKRGLFVRTRLLCMEIGAPPANAAQLPELDANLTTRERFEQHAKDATCASCHASVDPLGFAFEHFDEAGAYRTEEAGKPIDATGTLTYAEGWTGPVDGPGFASLPELGALLATSAQARRCFATQVLRFASGRRESSADTKAIDRLLAIGESAGGDPRAVLVGISQLPGFRARRAP